MARTPKTMAKTPHFPGYKAISDQVFVKETNPGAEPLRPDEPTTLIIYGWGDSLPKHITKYTTGYQALYGRARMVVVLSPMINALTHSPETRAKAMVPVIEAVFGSKTASGGDPDAVYDHSNERILVHVMSNTGGINFASTLHAYRTLYPGGGSDRPFPHTLLVCDSTPGSTHFRTNVVKWGRAMAIGLGAWFPWPFFVSQLLFMTMLSLNHAFEWLRGVPSSAVISVGAVLDPGLCSLAARRLYLYSKEDDIISWQDVEENAAEARKEGYAAELELFDKSTHVGHMKLHPDQYWGAIERSWKAAVAKKEL